MGAMLCCLRGVDRDDDNGQAVPPTGCCFCFQLPFFVNAYSAIRQRGDTRVAPEQGRMPLSCTASGQDDSTMDTFRCPPRPLPYDDPRFSQHVPDKASTHFQKYCELGESKTTDTESADMAERVCGSSHKKQAGDATNGGTKDFAPSDVEDVCPICLEEYKFDNPKETLQCNHHFHLCCIYEWMERDHQDCPVCGKVMLLRDDA